MRQQRMVVDLMEGDYYYATWRGMVDVHPEPHRGKALWVASESDLIDAISKNYPSVLKKKYQLVIVR